METYKTIVLSTGHISEADSIKLTNLSSKDFMFYYTGYGWIIKLYQGDMGEVEELNDYSCLSPELNLLIKTLHFQGYGMIEFDSDGPVCDWLAVYDW